MLAIFLFFVNAQESKLGLQANGKIKPVALEEKITLSEDGKYEIKAVAFSVVVEEVKLVSRNGKMEAETKKKALRVKPDILAALKPDN